MSKLGIVEDTLFIPMLGRLYASEHCPRILYDQKALELKEKLPFGLLKQDSQSQYTLLASAVRSANMDRFIRAAGQTVSLSSLAVAWRRPITAATMGRRVGMRWICPMW